MSAAIFFCLPSFSQTQIDSMPFNDEYLGYYSNDSQALFILKDPITSKLLIYRVNNSSTNRTSYEFIRKSDSSFMYMEFDSISNPIAYGTMMIDRKNFKSSAHVLPDWKKDPDGSKGIMKDTIIYTHFLRKQEFWQETDSLGNIWTGEYQYGKRTGPWIKGRYLPVAGKSTLKYFRILRLEYKENIPDFISAYYFDSITPSKMKGLWVYDLSNSSTWAHVFNKDSVHLANEEFLNFTTEKIYQYNCLRDKPKHSFDYTVCSGEWWLDHNRLYLKRGSELLKFEITTITDRRFALKPINEDNNNSSK